MTMHQHFRLLGWFLLVFGIITLAGTMIFGAILLHALGPLLGAEFSTGDTDQDEFLQFFFVVMPVALAINLAIGLVIGLLYTISGGGVLKRKRWARPFTIAASFVSLPGFPFWTALGIYGLWLMYSVDGTRAWGSTVDNPMAGNSGIKEPRQEGSRKRTSGRAAVSSHAQCLTH